jgi:glycine/D-amino acid oxidase-like deaminating enzyme
VDVDGYTRAILDRAARFVPAVASARIVGTRLCARPQTPDGRPLIGRIPWVEGLWVVAGHGPWGISTGPASGRLLADLVAGDVRTTPPTFEPGRFGAP